MVFKDTNGESTKASPMTLLYSAWSESQPTGNHRVAEQYKVLDGLLKPLPEQTRHQVYQAVYQITADSEKNAFLEGLRTAMRLAAELF